jgi:hypothetical protein
MDAKDSIMSGRSKKEGARGTLAPEKGLYVNTRKNMEEDFFDDIKTMEISV